MASPKKPKRKRRPVRPVPFRDPASLRPLDPEEFDFAMSIGFGASSMRMPSVSPSAYGINLADERTGAETRLAFTDIPENRMAFAVRDHFNDPEKFTSFMMRFWALVALRDDPRMAQYTKTYENEEAIGIHASAIEAAAQLPLNDRLLFDPDAFFSHAAKLRATKQYDAEPED